MYNVSRDVFDSAGVFLFQINFEIKSVDNLNWEELLLGYPIPESSILGEPVITEVF